METRVEADERRPHLSALDLVGVTVASWLFIWLLAAAARSGTAISSSPVAMLGLAAGAYLTARIVRSHGIWQLPAVATLGALTIAATQLEDLGDHLEGPLGYGNATASFFLLAAVHAAVVAHLAPWRPVRIAAGMAAGWFAFVPWMNGSRTAAILTLLAPLAVLAQNRRILPVAVRGGASLVAICVLTTSFAGVFFQEPTNNSRASVVLDATLSERRVELWQDAVALAREEPWFGVGVGAFKRQSPSAIAHPDKAWAHNEYLQLAAETGIIGMLLLLGLVLWGFARISGSSHDPAAPWVLLGWVSVSVHASFDYILHFPGVVAIAATLLGLLREPNAVTPEPQQNEPNVPGSASEGLLYPLQPRARAPVDIPQTHVPSRLDGQSTREDRRRGRTVPRRSLG